MSETAQILLIMAGLLVAIHVRMSYVEARKRRLIADFLNDPERKERQGL